MNRRSWLAAVAFAAFVSGCQASQGAPVTPLHCNPSADAPFAAAVGARANSEVPKLPQSVAKLMSGSARAGYKVTLVRADGEPKVVYDKTFKPNVANDVARDEAFRVFSDDLHKAFAKDTHAGKPEANPLAAVTLAARAVPQGGNVVLLDSGLQTTDPLRFQDGGLLESDPVEVAEYLKNQDLLPDLSGRKIILVGLGNTAPPQLGLNNRQHNKVIAIWKAIAEAGRAPCTEVIDDPGTATPVADVPPVTVVRLPDPPRPPPSCGIVSLGENNDVGFVRDQDVFLDERAARTTIQQIADTMRDGRQTAELIGTTADVGAYDGQVALSKRRAEAVKRVLVELGVSENRLHTIGRGSRFEGYVPDHGPGGSLLPGPAAQNRKVIVSLSCEQR